MRDLSPHQTVVAVVALIGVTVLGILDRISSEALIAVYSALAGNALGYVNGKGQGKK